MEPATVTDKAQEVVAKIKDVTVSNTPQKPKGEKKVKKAKEGAAEGPLEVRKNRISWTTRLWKLRY